MHDEAGGFLVSAKPVSSARRFVTWLLKATCLELMLLCFMVLGVLAATLIPAFPIERHLNELSPALLNDWDTCVAARVGLAHVADGLLQQALLSPTFEGCPDYWTYIASGEGLFNYWRLWHGYQILSKPILALGGMYPLKLSILVLVAFSTTLFVWQLLSLRAYRYAIAAVIALLCIRIGLPGVTDGLVWTLAFSAGAALIWLARRDLGISPDCGAHCFMALGALTIYFDWFTIQLLALTVPLLALLWCRTILGRALIAGSLTRNFPILSGAWTSGYVLTWIAKWVLVAIFTDEKDVFASVISHIMFRISGGPEEDFSRLILSGNWHSLLTGITDERTIGIGSAIAANLWQVRFGIIATLSLLIAKGISIVLSDRTTQNFTWLSKDTVGAAVILFAMPFLFMALTREHSYAHSSLFVPIILYPNFAMVLSIGLAGVPWIQTSSDEVPGSLPDRGGD